MPMGYIHQPITFRNQWVYVFNDLMYKCCEVYIDDMLIFGTDDENFLSNVRKVFQRCREKNVTLNSKKLTIGIDKVGNTICRS